MTYRFLVALPMAFASLVVIGGGCSTKPVDIGDFLDAGDRPNGFVPGDAASEAGPVDSARCPATTCPEPYLTCPDSTHLCDADPRSSQTNCGGCGNVCPDDTFTRSLMHASWTCTEGACVIACEPDFMDANHDGRDGCELNVRCDPANCGAVGNACGPGVACIDGTCGCLAGLELCASDTCKTSMLEACVDLQRNHRNCGRCGNDCTLLDTTGLHSTLGYRCNTGECKATCIDGQLDCNHDVETDGCEINGLFDANNCGACGNVCPAGKDCVMGACVCAKMTLEPGPCQCKSGRTLCEAFGGPSGFKSECRDLENDTFSCGVCHHACKSTERCRMGRCVLECPAGRADCNGNSDDVCEVDIESDPRNCGGCGITCDLVAGQPCVAGQCATVPCNQGPTR